MINEILYAFYMTMELWIFLGILMVALVVEEVIQARKINKSVDASGI